MTRRVEQLAIHLRRLGLAAPAALLLEAHRPLLPLLRQAGIAISPILDPLAGQRGLTASLLEDPATFNRLLAGLAGDPPPGSG